MVITKNYNMNYKYCPFPNKTGLTIDNGRVLETRKGSINLSKFKALSVAWN